MNISKNEQDLIDAIFAQAVNDYQKLNENPQWIPVGCRRGMVTKKKIKKFFRSKYFDMLCGEANPEIIRSKIYENLNIKDERN